MTSSIRKIRKYGFEPIAWGIYACEETFIFKTKEEAIDFIYTYRIQIGQAQKQIIEIP